MGDFNPAIFQPHWFSSQGLIPPAEAREAKDFVVHNELTVLKLPWVQVQVTHKQFIASTTQESHFEAVRDLVISIFSLLKHTPMQKIGINLEQHHRFADVERYKEFGHKLAPKDAWRKTLTDPGLVKMIVVQNTRDDGYRGHIQVDLEVSDRVRPGGVYFRVNDHFEWPPAEGAPGTETALKILSNEFKKSLNRSRKTIDSILSIA
ncbi:MAG: hypothetical protein AAB676_20215 [Verrucomicrobiota bacterium]